MTKILIDEAIVKLALEALENEKALNEGVGVVVDVTNQAITALRQAIEQAQKQEPAAFASHGVVNWIADKQFQHEADLYTSPQRQWIGLEQEDMPDGEDAMFDHPFFIAGMVYANNKLKEKNGG